MIVHYLIEAGVVVCPPIVWLLACLTLVFLPASRFGHRFLQFSG